MKHVLLLCIFLSPLLAGEPTLREQLREALYTEEVTRDPAAAAKQYEELLTQFNDQRPLAATALFRLAEVRRKQDRKDEAIALYQRLLRDFPDFATETKLARENLAGLGAKPALTAPAVDDEEAIELQRLQGLAKSAPDIFRDSTTLENAVDMEWPRVVAFLLEQGADPRGEGLLVDAASQGRLDICQLLMKNARPTPEDGLDALDVACRRGRLKVLTYLLESGIDPNPAKGAKRGSPLHEAIRSHQLEAANLLIKHGADVNFVSHWRLYPIGGEYFGTPLHQAVHAQDLVATRLLLGQGAKPDVQTPVTGIAALHLAACDRTDQGDALLDALLESGANPNLRTTLKPGDELAKDSLSAHFVLATPLALAIDRKKPARVKSLLTHGADPNTVNGHGVPLLQRATGDLPTLKLLLDAKADPNVRDAKGYPMLRLTQSIEAFKMLLNAGADPDALDPDGRPMLAISFDVEYIKLLLEAGADPNLPFGELRLDFGSGCDDPFAETPGEVLDSTNSALWEASRNSKRFPAFKALLEAGARPGPALGFIVQSVARWDEDGSITTKLLEFRPDRFNPAEIPEMESWQPAAREAFLQKAVYPAIAAKPEISFLFLHSGTTKPLADKNDGAGPPLLAPLLLQHLDFVSKPNVSTGDPTDRRSKLRLVRADASGSWSVQDLDLTGADAFPILKWGDIITAESTSRGDPFANPPKDDQTNYAWHIRKRITFPITVEIDGEAREITLNGGLLVYDPTRDEAPWLEATHLVELLAPVPPGGSLPDITVQRTDWEDIRLIADGNRLSRLTLQANDRVVVGTEDGVRHRTNNVLLTVPGYRFFRSFGESQSTPKGNMPIPPTHPTLIQAIVDTYAPWTTDQIPDRDGELGALLAAIAGSQENNILSIPTVLPHPDFGRIRIRRVGDSGTEEILEVDLAAAVARCTDDTPAGEAREADMPLQAGDIVELPLYTDRLDQDWAGFNPAEVRFFQKALSGRIQFIPSAAKPALVELSWQPTRWQPSPGGLLPLLPENGSATMRLSEVILPLLARPAGQNFVLERDQKRSPTLRGSKVFVRDRDQVYWERRAPRPRLVPIPPSKGR